MWSQVDSWLNVRESNENNNVLGPQNITVTTAGVLSVTPADGLTSSGYQGGPFNPSSKNYTLQNTGGSSINWTASKAQTWDTLSSTSGTLAANASTTVTVSINSNANSLTPGSYGDTVSFTNTTNGNGNNTRSVNLTVYPDTTPPDTSITGGPSGTITYNNPNFTYTGTDNVTPTANLVYATYLQGYDSGWSSFSSSTTKSYSNLPNGSYTFQVKAKDQAGNEDPTPCYKILRRFG